MAWPSGPMVEGMSGLRKLAKERSVAEAGAQNFCSSDCSSWGFLALLNPRSGEESAAVLRVFGPKVFSGPDFLLRLGGRSGAEAGFRQGSSSNSQLSVRGFLLPVNPRPGAEAAPGLRGFLSKGLADGDLLLLLDGRLVADPGLRKGSSSNLSGRGFLLPVNARPDGESAPGRWVFPPPGLSDGDFLLLLDGRSVADPGVRKGSSSNRSGRGFLLPVNVRPGAESVAGLRLFPPTGLACGELLLPRGGRAVVEGMSGLLFLARAGFRGGFFLLTDKGSPREKKGKK